MVLFRVLAVFDICVYSSIDSPDLVWSVPVSSHSSVSLTDITCKLIEYESVHEGTA